MINFKNLFNKNPRKYWAELFQKAGSKNDTEKLIPNVFEDENLDDWEW